MKIADYLSSLSHRRRSVAARRRRIIRRSCENTGLVYFGSVDQQSDEHRVVRGFSASPTHSDDSYCVGDYEDYSVAIVDRSDILEVDGKKKSHNWLIIEVDLPRRLDIPHSFLVPIHGSIRHFAKIFTAFRSLEKVSHHHNVGDFHSRFSLYATPDHHSEVESIFTEENLRVIAAHFWPAAVEVTSTSVFIYYADKILHENTVETLLKNSVWLCQTLEKTVEAND